MNAFFISQFNYCHVIWMCHSGALNNKINKLHERCLLIIYNDETSTFKELLEKDNSVSILYKNIQALAIEMYKVANVMSHCGCHGSESVSYLGPNIWELIPPVLWQIDTFSRFKKAIKNGSLLTVHAEFAKHTYLA